MRARPLLVAVVVLGGMGALFALGLFLRREKQTVLAMEGVGAAPGVATVRTVPVKQGQAADTVNLPGTISGVNETRLFSRLEGYIIKRHVGLGDRVTAGQVLVEIESPELEQQVRQAEARLVQARASLTQAQATRQQAAANLKIAETTEGRWQQLVNKGIVSKQEGDERSALAEARRADLAASDANIQVAQENIAVLETEVKRLETQRAYRKVLAPFAGVITSRTCDTGDLVSPQQNSGTRELFRLTTVDNLRMLADVPENYAPYIKVGVPVEVTVAAVPGKTFAGTVSRTAQALNAETRTLLVEALLPTGKGMLLPGMDAHVRYSMPRRAASLIVPGDSLVTRSNGTMVATVDHAGKVRFVKVQVGRDYGTEVEITGGLTGEERIVVSPGDDVKEGAVVRAR